MSKAVLRVDMPKCCKYCFRYQADPWFGGSCTQAKEDGWNKQIGADDEYSVQSWCPLRPHQEAIPIEWIKSKIDTILDSYPDGNEETEILCKLLYDWEKENETS